MARAQGSSPLTPALRADPDHDRAEHWNTDPPPFIWEATAEDVITKVRRGRQTLNQLNSQTAIKQGDRR